MCEDIIFDPVYSSPLYMCLFIRMVERWVRVSNDHAGRDLWEEYEAYLHEQAPVDLMLATMFELSVKCLYENKDPILLQEWIDVLDVTEGWKWWGIER